MELKSLQVAFCRYSPACPSIAFLSNPQTPSSSKFTFKIFEVYHEKDKQISNNSFLFFVRLIWLGFVCQQLNCDWLGWSDKGILHLHKWAHWEESNKQNYVFSCETWNVSTISTIYKSRWKWAHIGHPDLETVTGAISSSSPSLSSLISKNVLKTWYIKKTAEQNVIVCCKVYLHLFISSRFNLSTHKHFDFLEKYFRIFWSKSHWKWNLSQLTNLISMLSLKGDLEEWRNAEELQRITRWKHCHLGKLGNQTTNLRSAGN